MEYVKMASNIMWIKKYFKICKFYLEDISNMKSQIIDEHYQKRQKSDIKIIIELEEKKTSYI